MDCESITVLDFDKDIKGRRSTSFEDRFLCAASTRFLIRQCNCFDPTNKITQRWIEEQVIKRLTVCRTDELHTALGNCTGCSSFEFAPNLVNDDHFGVMIFNRFDHYFMLKHWLAYLHTTCFANRGMRYIT